MSYQYTIETLLLKLEPGARRAAKAVLETRRHVHHGLLPVGLKIHCLSEAPRLQALFTDLQGATNPYRRSAALECITLPPLGNSRAAIGLVEALEIASGEKIFNNPSKFQLQICSASRLENRSAAMLCIGFYLGSDLLRKHSLEDLKTTFSSHREPDWERGRRLVLYDAWGTFDRGFSWWKKHHGALVISSQLPFTSERTDMLGIYSKVDIENVNLLATLLVHQEHSGQAGWWASLGYQFKQEIESLLDEHLLMGLLSAPWVHTEDSAKAGDHEFISALEELMHYALEDLMRANRIGYHAWKAPEVPVGLLWSLKRILTKYRRIIVEESHRLQGGEPT